MSSRVTCLSCRTMFAPPAGTGRPVAPCPVCGSPVALPLPADAAGMGGALPSPFALPDCPGPSPLSYQRAAPIGRRRAGLWLAAAVAASVVALGGAVALLASGDPVG